MEKRDIRDILNELSERLDEELQKAYDAGWTACARRIKENLAPAPPAEQNTLSIGGLKPRAEKAEKEPGKRAPRGYWQSAVSDVVLGAGPDGLTVKQAFAKLEDADNEGIFDYPLSYSSFSAALKSLIKEGRVSKSGKHLLWADFLSPDAVRDEPEPETDEIEDEDVEDAAE